MKRIDRVINEGRMLRIHRAVAARTALSAPGDDGAPGGQGAGGDPGLEWSASVEAAQRVLADLMEARLLSEPPISSLPSSATPSSSPPSPAHDVAGARLQPVKAVRARLDVFDPIVLAPFVDRCQLVLEALVAEMRPQDAVFAQMWPRVCAAVSANLDPGPREEWTVDGGHPGAGDGARDGVDDAGPAAGEGGEGEDGDRKPRDGNRARRSAVADVCVLATEMALFEVVRRLMRANDLRRPVSERPGALPIAVSAGRVHRVKPAKPVEMTPGQLNAARSFGRLRRRIFADPRAAGSDAAGLDAAGLDAAGPNGAGPNATRPGTSPREVSSAGSSGEGSSSPDVAPGMAPASGAGVGV